MGKTYSRIQILSRLKKCINEEKPIIGAGAGFGLVAKCEEIGGADLIVVYATGISRRMGLRTFNLGDANELVRELGEEILFVVKETPVIAGVQATDPTKDIGKLINNLLEMGYSGIINYPSVGLYGHEWINGYYDEMDIEIEIMQKAKEKGIFTMTYIYNIEEAKKFANAVDLIVAHAGWTAGGLVGNKNAMSISEACEHIQRIIEATRQINPDIISLAHGGPFVKPEDTKYLYEKTDVDGYLGASSIERIPIEEAVVNIVKNFKSVSRK